MVPIEDLDLIMVGGGAYRKWGKDVDLRVQASSTQDLLSFAEGTPEEDILNWVGSVINLPAVCEMVSDLIDDEVPVDGGVTVFVGGMRKSAMFNSMGLPTHLLDYKVFQWCYYIQRGGIL